METIINTLRNYVKKIVQLFKKKKTMISKNKVSTLIKALNEVIEECNTLQNNAAGVDPALVKECIGMPYLGTPLLEHMKKLEKLNNHTTPNKKQSSTTSSNDPKGDDQPEETTTPQKNSPILKNKAAPVNEKKKIVKPHRKHVKTHKEYLKKKK